MDFVADTTASTFVVDNVVNFLIHKGRWGCWGIGMTCRVLEVVVLVVGFSVTDMEGGAKTGICGPADGDRGSLRVNGGNGEGAIVARH